MVYECGYLSSNILLAVIPPGNADGPSLSIRAYGPSIGGSDEPLFELVDRPENCVGLSWVIAEAYLN